VCVCVISCTQLICHYGDVCTCIPRTVTSWCTHKRSSLFEKQQTFPARQGWRSFRRCRRCDGGAMTEGWQPSNKYTDRTVRWCTAKCCKRTRASTARNRQLSRSPAVFEHSATRHRTKNHMESRQRRSAQRVFLSSVPLNCPGRGISLASIRVVMYRLENLEYNLWDRACWPIGLHGVMVVQTFGSPCVCRYCIKQLQWIILNF